MVGKNSAKYTVRYSITVLEQCLVGQHTSHLSFIWFYLLFFGFRRQGVPGYKGSQWLLPNATDLLISAEKGRPSPFKLKQSVIVLFFWDDNIFRSGTCPLTGLLVNICPTGSASTPLLRLVCRLDIERRLPPLCLSLCLFLSLSTPIIHKTHSGPLLLTLTKSSKDEKKTELGPLLCPFLSGQKAVCEGGGGSAIIVGT